MRANISGVELGKILTRYIRLVIMVDVAVAVLAPRL